MRNATLRDTKPAKGNLVYCQVFAGPGDKSREEAERKAKAMRSSYDAAACSSPSAPRCKVTLTERLVRADCVHVSI